MIAHQSKTDIGYMSQNRFPILLLNGSKRGIVLKDSNLKKTNDGLQTG